MVLKFIEYPHLFRAYIISNRQRKKILYSNYQKKHLSNMVPFYQKHGYIRQKLDEFITWYDEFTGMDEVRKAQKRVLEDEDNFRTRQEERRKVLNELTEIQHKLKDLYAELDSTNRGDERYVVLVTQEHKLLKEEKSVLEKFSKAEKLERDSFAALSSSVKLSHEKERAQSERTKYWSIIGSILGTVLGILGSSINNHFKMNELKQLIKNSTNTQIMECLNTYIESNEKVIEKYKDSLLNDERNSVVKIENLLKSMNNRLIDVEISVKNVEQKKEKNNEKVISDSDIVVNVPVELEKLPVELKKEYNQTKMLLFTLAFLSILMPIISKNT